MSGSWILVAGLSSASLIDLDLDGSQGLKLNTSVLSLAAPAKISVLISTSGITFYLA